VKLIVLAIPPLTALGMLLDRARDSRPRPGDGGVRPALVYGFPFQWGFVNFALSIALALNAFALWLRLGSARATAAARAIVRAVWARDLGRPQLRLGRARPARLFGRVRPPPREGHGFLQSVWHGGLACFRSRRRCCLMIAWRSGYVGGQTTDWFNWAAKFVYLLSTLRNHAMRSICFSLSC
jgi:hypothetical protein